eukprot:15433204-Alexandrium_andersonii.AAC.1
MQDQDRIPVPWPPAQPEAPHPRVGAPVPERGLGTRSDSSVFLDYAPSAPERVRRTGFGTQGPEQ